MSKAENETKEENNKEKKRSLVKFATEDSQLVWSRYGCMVVANSILLGFTGQLAIKKCHVGWLGIWACSIGLFIAFVWLFITSYGWHLSWHTLTESGSEELKVYEEWKKKVWGEKTKDPIWFYAHLAILAFCVAYILLIIHFSVGYFVPAVFIVLSIFSFGRWLYLFYVKLKISNNEDANR